MELLYEHRISCVISALHFLFQWLFFLLLFFFSLGKSSGGSLQWKGGEGNGQGWFLYPLISCSPQKAGVIEN